MPLLFLISRGVTWWERPSLAELPHNTMLQGVLARLGIGRSIGSGVGEKANRRIL